MTTPHDGQPIPLHTITRDDITIEVSLDRSLAQLVFLVRSTDTGYYLFTIGVYEFWLLHIYVLPAVDLAPYLSLSSRERSAIMTALDRDDVQSWTRDRCGYYLRLLNRTVGQPS